jgi:N-dimethylarginine dimethylaminohydrolase
MSVIIGSGLIWNKSKCSKNYIVNERKINECLNNIAEAFKSQGIQVYNIYIDYGFCNLLWIRDMFVNINNQILICKCTQDSTENVDRSNEYKIIKQIFPKSIVCPYKLEGGDIIETKDALFCGIGIRTNYQGSKFIKNYTKKRIINIKHSALHLDCCFMVLDKLVFYSKKYIKKLPKFIYDNYKIIILENLISDTNLSTNIVRIKNTLLISNNRKFYNLREYLKHIGYKLIEINTDTIMKFGGSIRCASQWEVNI